VKSKTVRRPGRLNQVCANRLWGGLTGRGRRNLDRGVISWAEAGLGDGSAGEDHTRLVVTRPRSCRLGYPKVKMRGKKNPLFIVGRARYMGQAGKGMTRAVVLFLLFFSPDLALAMVEKGI